MFKIIGVPRRILHIIRRAGGAEISHIHIARRRIRRSSSSRLAATPSEQRTANEFRQGRMESEAIAGVETLKPGEATAGGLRERRGHDAPGVGSASQA